MKKLLGVLIVIFAAAAPAQDKSPAPKQVPVITDQVQKHFFKAKADLLAEQQRLQQVQVDFQAVLQQMTLICDGKQPIPDPDGYPVCPAPAPPPPAESKK